MCNQQLREILLYEFKFGRFAGKATTTIKTIYGISQDPLKFCTEMLFGVLITNIVFILYRNPTFNGIR
ncbi:hypothetical protein Y032_0656g1210 [Ancylostoma ceylanicum]|uniref:Uncharacterized protein n=1 Tax=Ancylostoma ceylanicum TaxID=53326 RepID=A0A016WHY5_9BILA|nr:hypothetical protein Y032_0656g1210 [Ancylostoma ceylanicum]